MDWNDATERAIWTAVEAGLAVLIITDVSTYQAAGIAAVAALIAGVKAFARAKITNS